MNSTKKGGLIAVLAVFFCCLFALPIVVNLTSNNSGEFQDINAVEIKECNIEYAQNQTSVNLVSGMIRMNNVEVDNIFINIEHIGVQDLTYTTSITTTANASYVTYRLDKTNTICATCFDSDTEVVAHIYIEYEGRAYKVDTQTIAVKGCLYGPF